MDKHSDSFLEPTALGKQWPLYKPTFTFVGEYIDDFHKSIASSAPQESSLINLDEVFGTAIKGRLRCADALKLYEIAYFVQGDVLELGCGQGLSTCILSKANHNSGLTKRIDSVDLSPEYCAKTMESLKATKLNSAVEITCSEAAAAVRRLAETARQFHFVFIDHSHSYQPVYEVCQALPQVVNAGGFCLFHDFNDRRNEDPNEPDYGVYRAVLDGLKPKQFEFYGIYGCTGLYRMQG
jgi:predicted O-methyltransferase YrrM